VQLTRLLGGPPDRGACSPCTERGLASRRVATTLVGSYPTFSPLPSTSREIRRRRSPFCATFRRLSPPGSPQRPALWCPDFPRAPRGARGHPACILDCSRDSTSSWIAAPHSGQAIAPSRCWTNSPQTRHSRLAPRSSASTSWSSVRISGVGLTACERPQSPCRGFGRWPRRSAPSSSSPAASGSVRLRGRTA